MYTDTFFQLIDKLIIAQLKGFHFNKDGNQAAWEIATEQARHYAKTAEVLLYECVERGRIPDIQKHVRYHDHHKVEGRWNTKEAEKPDPSSITEAISMLANVHATSWTLQTRVQTLKTLIDGAQGEEKSHWESEFVKNQRLIDLQKQHRSHLVQRGDELFRELIHNG